MHNIFFFLDSVNQGTYLWSFFIFCLSVNISVMSFLFFLLI